MNLKWPDQMKSRTYWPNAMCFPYLRVMKIKIDNYAITRNFHSQLWNDLFLSRGFIGEFELLRFSIKEATSIVSFLGGRLLWRMCGKVWFVCLLFMSTVRERLLRVALWHYRESCKKEININSETSEHKN